jgi:hypothetical protein
MRALSFLFPVLLTSCGSVVTQNEIFVQARAEIARREAWADDATILIQQRPDDWHLTWVVSAGSFNYNESPSVRGLRVVPGTERELRFTRKGCLIRYTDSTSRCLDPSSPAPVSTSDPMPAAK